MKSNSVMEFAYDAPTVTLSWMFTDGTTAEFCTDATTAEVRNAAMVHGFKQKIADAAAISRNAETGLPATVAEKRAAMVAVIQNLESGEWNAASGGGANIGGLLAVAIANVDAKNVDNVRAFLKDKTPAQRAAFASHKKYAKEYKRLQDAQLTAKAAGVKIDDLTAELDAIV